jgi:hypothetical protein
MDIKAVTTTDDPDCKSEIHLTSPCPIKQEYNKKISDENYQVSLPYPSQIIHYQVNSYSKIYYLAYYTFDYEFFLYDISNYNMVDMQEKAIGLVKKVDLKHPDLLNYYDYCA